MQGRVPAVATAATDGEGRFAIPFPLRYAATLLVEADGFGRRWVEVREEESAVDVRLRRGGSLRGRVLAPDGAPAAGARILVLPRDALRLAPERPLDGLHRDAAELPEGWFESFEDLGAALPARTDGEGRYRVDGLEEGVAYHAYAAATGCAASIPAADLVGSAPGGILEREFRLREPAALALDLQAPAGFGDGGMEIEVENGGRRRTFRRDGPGVVLLEGLEPGAALVRIDGPSFVHAEVSADIAAGERAERVLVLDPGESLGGLVVDDTGAKLAEARVWIRPEIEREGGGWRDTRSATSAPDGTFRVSGLPPGPWILSSRCEERTVEGIPVPDAFTPLRVVLPRPARVSFRAILPEGSRGPGEGWVVCGARATREDAPEAGPWDYASGELPPGPVRLLAWEPGFVPIVRDLDLRPGEARDLGDIVLERGGTIRGRVLDDRGDPVGRGTVAMIVDPETWYGNPAASTAEDGSFVLTGIPEGAVRLRASAEGMETVEAEVAAGERDAVVLVSERLAVLEFRVESPAGRPQANVKVTLRRADGTGRPECDTTGDDGSFGGRFRVPFRSLHAGTWSVLLERHGVFVEAGEVTLERGETREVRLVFP